MTAEILKQMAEEIMKCVPVPSAAGNCARRLFGSEA
jgi:hypothetical protein